MILGYTAMYMKWKIIPDTNERYLCNKLGDIKRCDGSVKFGTQTRKIGGILLKAKTKSNGYKEVNLQLLNQVGTSRYVHRLIASTWIGVIPHKLTVNHKDLDKGNNRVDNLEIISQSDNNQHARTFGTFKSSGLIGSKHPRAKTDEAEVLKIRKEHKTHRSIKQLMHDYPHLPKSTLTKVVYSVSWNHI